MNRREALTRLGGFMAAGIISGQRGARAAITGDSITTPAGGAASASVKEFSLAHITDIHIFSQHHAENWFRKCLHQVQSHKLKPQMIINTGDCVFETLKADRARADELWKIWNNTLASENSLPIRHCLGNHDHWGLGLEAADPARKDPMYGKQLGMAALGLEKPYYSFDHGGWHFIMLDSVQPNGIPGPPGWTAKLDDEQFHWLKKDLASIPEKIPVAVYSHMPIVSMAPMIHQKPDKEGVYRFGPHGVMGDARRIIDLFAKHPNVKICFSGHLHLQDRVEISGVTYICDGSVCGQWWRGDHLNCPPGYSITTFRPDGTFDHKYSTYGWHGEEEKTEA